jgi:hypothetical protein
MNLRIEIQYFPSIYSISCLIKSTHIDFCLSESWERRSFRNRTVIATANGLLSLSIPVEGGRNQRALFRDIRIDYQDDWRARHWRSIFSAYGKSPWFFQYADGLESVYRHQDHFLVDWNFRCLDWVCSALRLDAATTLVQTLRQPSGTGKWLPAGQFTGVASALPGNPASGYPVPAPGAVPVINLKDRVTPANFQDSSLGTFPRYPQVFEERWGFQPNLSVIDLIFCVGPGALALLQGMEIRLGD